MRITIILLVALTILACQESSKSNAVSQDQLSSWICQCAKPIVEYNDELKKLAETDNIGLLTEKMASGDQVMKATELCITNKLNASILKLLDSNLHQQISLQCRLDQRMIDDLIKKLVAFDELTFK